MGTCISKCSLRTSSAIHPNPPQDKLVISHSNPAAIASSSTSFTLDSSKSNSSSSSSSKTEQNSSESTSFPAKKKQHIITLDNTRNPSAPIPRPKPQPQTAAKTTQLPAKRGRPSSPKPFVQKKIMRREAPILRRASNSRPWAGPWADPPLAAIDYRKEKAIPSGRVVRRVRFVHPEQSNGGRMEGIDNPLISMECFIFL